MKKFIMMTVMAVLCLTANAQSRHKAGSLTFQPMIGITSGVVGGDDGTSKIENDEARVGITAGAEAEFYTNTRWLSFSAGAMYAQQGWEFKNSFTAKLDYINFPILANFYVAKGLALKIGIQPGILVSAKEDGDDVKSYCEDFNFSMPIGISYEFKNRINIEARWNTGWTTINKNTDKFKLHSHCLMLMIGYKFQ